MRKIIGILMAFLFAYICFAYMELNYDMFSWDRHTRLGFILVSITWGLLTTLFIENNAKV